MTLFHLDSPAILNKIKDDEFKKFAKALNELWKVLGRRVSHDTGIKFIMEF